MIEICLWREAEHAGTHLPDPDRPRGRAPAWLRDHHRRRAYLRRRNPAADRDPVHGPGPAVLGRAGRTGPGGSRRRAAAPVLPAHRQGRGAAGHRDRTPPRHRRGRGAAAERAARRRHRMSAQDTERAAALERRYRRLLRCYPPGHRLVHREEMLGVLLATARPGQRAPGARQTVNLVTCGLDIRARRALSSLADESWQDALAVVSLITPAVMLITAALDFAAGIREAVVELHANPQAGPFWQPWHGPFL